LVKKLGGPKKVNATTVANIRAEFRHTLKVLQEIGHLKGVRI
jgi:hypothetical protein